MKILLINPVATDVWDEKDRKYLEGVAAPGTELDIVSLDKGPKSIESYCDEAHAAPEVLKLGREADGYSAIIINCFADPGLFACREATETLVLGAGETAMTAATLLGNKIGVISILGNASAQIETTARRMGISDRLAYAAGIDVPVLDIEGSAKTEKELISHAQAAIERGAEVLVLGCTGLLEFADILRGKFDCPVIEPAAVTLKMAEALGSIGLSHSRTGQFSAPGQ